MDKLTLCKKIAEIEGIKVSECKGQLIRMDLPFGTSLNAMMSLSKAKTLNDYKMAQDEYGKAYYDPLTDKALLLDLMVKYEAWINWYTFTCEIRNAFGTVSSRGFRSKSVMPRAILECIVEADNG